MKNNDVSHEHAPIDSYFAPIPGGEVPETFSPFAPIPEDDDNAARRSMEPPSYVRGVIASLNERIKETKDFLAEQCHVPGGRDTPEYRAATNRLDNLRDLRQEWLKA
jgi:hypothetical protein